MRIVRGLESYPPDAGQSAVALGVFDGVHLGHRAILATAVAEARRHGLVALACTFDPHPLEVLQPARAPLPLTSLDDRLRSEEHTSELQSHLNLVCRLLLEKKKLKT